MPINRARVDVLSQEKVVNLIPELAGKAPIHSPLFTGLPTLSQSGLKFHDGTQTKEGLPSRTTIIKKTESYTLSSLSERDCMIEMNSTLPVTLTVPVDQLIDYPVGTSIDILQANTGQVTVSSQAITLGTFGSGGSASGITLSLSTENLNVEPGQQIAGTGIVPGTLVVSTNGTQIVVDTPFTSQVSGQLTFSVGLSATPGRKLRTKWSSATLFKRGRNSWLLFGDLDE